MFPELAVYNKQGKPETVKYQILAPIMLNEFLKEHQRVEEQSQTQAALVKQLAAQGQTIAAQGRTNIELGKQLAAQARSNALQQDEIKELTASLKEQTSLLQKVSAQIELNRPAPQVVSNDH